MMKRDVVLALLACGGAPSALACGVCVLAAVDEVTPPARLWFFLPLSWFLFTGFGAAVAQVKPRLVPGPLLTIILAASAFVIGGAVLGPVATAPLLIPAVAALIAAIRGSGDWPRLARVALIVIGLLHLAVGIAGVGKGLRILRTRSEAEYICQWPATALGHQRFNALAKRHQAAAPTYRYIIAHSQYDYLTLDAAKALAVVGSGNDIISLERLRPKFRGNIQLRGELELAIQTLRRRAGGA